MFSLNQTILGVRTRDLMNNAMLQKIGFKGRWSIFTTSIKSECFDFRGELSFNHGFKKNKLEKDFNFRLKLVNPSKSYKVINKQNIISKAIFILHRCRTPHIRVYKFRRRRCNKLRFSKRKIMHSTIQTMCTRMIQISILIQYRLEIRKKKFEIGRASCRERVSPYV